MTFLFLFSFWIQRELDEELEIRPTFDQLSIERIFDEAQKNLTALKSLESIVNERLNAYTVLHNNSMKVKSAFECFESFDGSLKMALDSFFLYNEQLWRNPSNFVVFISW